MNPLQELHDLDAPRTGLTAEGLVHSGRARVRRRRRVAAAGTAAAVLVLLTAGAVSLAAARPQPDPRPALPQPSESVPQRQCRPEWLPVSGKTPTEPPVVDPTGHWAAAVSANHSELTIWHDGAKAAELHDRPFVGVAIAGISAKGAVAVTAVTGVTAGGSGPRRPMIFTSGYTQALTLPPGTDPEAASEAFAMNSAGDVVGYVKVGGVARAVRWPYRDPGRPVLLATPADRSSTALAIGEDGTVGGFLADHLDAKVPYVWRADGTGLALTLPPDVPSGAVQGVAGDWAADYGRDLRWRLAEPGRSEPLGAGGAGHAIAADGTVVTGQEVLDGHGQVALLPPDGYDRFALSGISADGRVVTGVAITGDAPAVGLPLQWVCGG
ncbi:hypothetical protein Dvina_22745 [Dactylosporangium vinaceum]|uniref:Uncharacterized protein n=1 Tax=Dactylosporangium vinaceum TaxID=53362 RepID=A0ABV5M749_9ACTN|nr:hypothetical protein [Dactylosporangium vinaceum]UAC00619.1 hypothetical protein Dvina_22745 [Dactylosporangium vinaceum]